MDSKKNTIVIFLSDHSEGFDHNYNFAHGNVLYNSSIRIPLIIKVPWLKPVKSVETGLIDNTDIMPTLIRLLELGQVLKNTDGISFAEKFDSKPNFVDRNKDGPKNLIFIVSAGSNKYSLTDGKYKYIYSFPDSCFAKGKVREELYDISTDSNETIDLSNIENRVYDRFKDQLKSFLKKYNLPAHSKKRNNRNNENEVQIDRLESLSY